MSNKTKIYVCTEGKKCPKKSSKAVAKALSRAAEELGGDSDSAVVVKECKCLDLCKKGPAVVVMPDKVKYGRVTPSDAAEIISTHIAGGEPLKRLLIKKKE